MATAGCEEVSFSFPPSFLFPSLTTDGRLPEFHIGIRLREFAVGFFFFFFSSFPFKDLYIFFFSLFLPLPSPSGSGFQLKVFDCGRLWGISFWCSSSFLFKYPDFFFPFSVSFSRPCRRRKFCPNTQDMRLRRIRKIFLSVFLEIFLLFCWVLIFLFLLIFFGGDKKRQEPYTSICMVLPFLLIVDIVFCYRSGFLVRASVILHHFNPRSVISRSTTCSILEHVLISCR